MDLNIRVAGEAGQGIKTTGDLLVALTEQALETLAAEVSDSGMVLHDGDDAEPQ